MLFQLPVILCQWYSRIASAIVAIVIVIENAIVSFYDQICDCKCKTRKEIMFKIMIIFTMVNSLQDYSCKHTQTQFSTTFCNDIHIIKYNYLQSEHIITMIH